MRKYFIAAILSIIILNFIHPASIDFSIGGAFTGYLIPTINYNSYDYVTPTTRTYAENINLFFGMALTMPVSINYNFNNGWGIGGSFESGYSFHIGPHIYSRYAPSDFVPTDYVYMLNAFYGIFDFLLKSPRNKYGFRAVAEFGLVIRPGILSGFYRTGRLYFAEGPGSSDFRFLFYAGPNIFIGFQKAVSSSVILVPGFRFSGEFAAFRNNKDPRYYQNEFYVLANFGFELKIMWNKTIVLASPSTGTTKSTKPKKTVKPKVKTKPKKKVEEEYK